MPRLSIWLLGQFQVALDDARVTFHTDKARALLAYLAVEEQWVHRRERLAALLWPERAENTARASLRQALHELRQVLHEAVQPVPFLQILPTEIQFSRASEHWIDAAELLTLAAGCSLHTGHPAPGCCACARGLEQAALLYHGEFMTGFLSTGSPDFDDWRVVQQERLHECAVQVMAWLAAHAEGSGNLDAAVHWANRCIELEPWDEAAHRHLMQLLAMTGRRDSALRAYEQLRRRLCAELGTGPAPETEHMYARIRAGR